VRGLGLAVKVGLHAGEIEYVDQAMGGIAVFTGHRIMQAAEPGEVLVSHTVKELVAGSGITFRDRGTHILKGLPGEWRLFAPDVHDAEAVTS
jgi:class 3 adenylate cyclase